MGGGGRTEAQHIDAPDPTRCKTNHCSSLLTYFAIKAPWLRPVVHASDLKIAMTQAVFSFLVFVVVLGTCLSAIVPGQLTVPPTDESRGCTLMTGLSLEYCGFGRNCTTLPNMREHTTLAEAEAEFSSFVPLLNCSDSMRIFLCFYYFPIPLPQRLLQGRTRQEINDIAHRFLPCRSVCDTARANCEMYIAQHSIQTRRQLASWQPHLNCSLFPDDNGNPTCIRRPSPSPTPPVQTDDQRPRTPAANASYTPTVLPPSDSPTATPSPTSSSPTSNSTTVTPTCATCALVRSGISTRALIKKAYSLSKLLFVVVVLFMLRSFSLLYSGSS